MLYFDEYGKLGHRERSEEWEGFTERDSGTLSIGGTITRRRRAAPRACPAACRVLPVGPRSRVLALRSLPLHTIPLAQRLTRGPPAYGRDAARESTRSERLEHRPPQWIDVNNISSKKPNRAAALGPYNN